MFDQMLNESEVIDELMSNPSNTSSGIETQPIMKTCSDCGTNRTPLWRGGPAGPKSLCNACGIRSRKSRRALLGLTNPDVKKSHANKSKKVTILTTDRDDGRNCSSSSTSEISGDEKMLSDVTRMRMEGLTWHRSTAGNKRRGVVLGEEEQAAVSLMAMAYSSVLF